MPKIMFYSDAFLRENKKKLALYICLLCFFITLPIALIIVLLFFINDDTFALFCFLMSLFSVLFVWAIIYLLTAYLFPLASFNKLAKKFNKKAREEYQGEVLSVDKERTISSFSKVWLIEVKVNESIKRFYLDMYFKENPFKKGMKVVLFTDSPFIIAYEVINE